MVERQDIDALLISALYGELTPAEETRLAAHLESHPGDRTALADLTHARGLVRESRILQVQLEPPQSVSALLMQEAKRCAPRAEVQEGWFARFVRSFMQHPAMAAAAMLVVVLGIATLVSKRSGDQFAESTVTTEGTNAAPSVATPSDLSSGMAAAGSGSAAPASDPTEPPSAVTAGIDTDKGEIAASKDQYRVQLDETVGSFERSKELEGKDKQKKAEQAEKPTKGQAEVSGNLDQNRLPRQEGIELRAKEPVPKDFEAPAAKLDSKPDAKNERRYASERGDSDSAGYNTVAPTTPSAPETGATFGGGGAANVKQDPSAGKTGSTTTVNRSADNSRPADNARPGNATPRGASPPKPTTTAPAPAAPPPPPRAEPQRNAPAKTANVRDGRAAGPSEDRAADPQLAWAREQHAALIAQVRAGDCRKAAGIATSISNRAPGYYQQNVETDRAVKDCIAYINSERERDAEQRAERARANQKRSVNEASPAPSKAAPSKPTATDTAKDSVK